MEPCGQVPLTELIESQNRASPLPFPSNASLSGGIFSSYDSLKQSRLKMTPKYAHRWTCDEAVTTVAYHDRYLFAGTVSGMLITYNLQTYQEVFRQRAHTGSILTMIAQGGLLFTGSSDSLVKIWIPGPEPQFKHTVYVVTDIGDVFSMAFHTKTCTLYLGTQNASIHWVRIDEEALCAQQASNIDKMPAVRPSRFFDSTGPGGRLAPQQHEARKRFSSPENDEYDDGHKELVEVPLDNQIAFAHHSSVFTMVLDYQRHLLVTGSGDGLIKMWSVGNPEGKPVETNRLQVANSVLSMSLASSWQLCCGLDNNGILIVDLETLQVITHDFGAAEGPLLALDAIEDGIFVSCANDILAFDATTAEVCSWTTPGLVTAITTLPKSVTAGQVVSAGSDGSVILWNVALYNEDNEEDENAHEERGACGDSVGEKADSEIKHEKEKSLLLKCRNLRTEPLGNDAMFNFLAKIIKFQTVSGRDRQFWSESRKCATVLRDQMRLMGATSDLLRVEDGNPIVLAEFKASCPKKDATVPRAIFYGHYDVIEASRDDLKWDTPPFQLTSINGYMYGRGVTDDKGPCTAAIFAVAKLFADKTLSSDVIFLLEGEEESGSFGFLDTIEQHRARIGNIDWIIFSNSLWLDDSRPCLNYGLRGVIFLEIELTSDKGDVHSGVDGGLFREPAKDMINLLSKMTTDNEGVIAIPGFFDAVTELTPSEEQLYDDIVANTSTSRDDLLHKWRYPSLTIHKFEVSGPHNQTVIPANVKAYLSLRLVPSQTAQGIAEKLRDHLNSEFARFNSPNFLNIRVKYEADPWLGDPENELFTLMRDSVQKVWGLAPLFIREGGSIPVARALEKRFNAPAAQLPCGQSSDGAHLNNERMRTTNMLNARSVFEEVFSNLKIQGKEKST